MTHKKGTGKMELTRNEAVKAGLAFGWVDSLPRAVDDARTSVYFSPRNPSSGWSRVNKGLIEELMREGTMSAAGLEAVARAKASGAWSKLDAAEALELPADLVAALNALGSGARANWEAFSQSHRKNQLQFIYLAVRPETRSARVQRVAHDAAAGVRAGKRPAAPPMRHADGAVSALDKGAMPDVVKGKRARKASSER